MGAAFIFGGAGGIRTLEPENPTNTLAGCRFRPLSHHSTYFAIAIKGKAEGRMVLKRFYVNTKANYIVAINEYRCLKK